MRKSNFELMRIVSMFLIVMHHYAIHGNFININNQTKVFLDIFSLGGKLGVNSFVILSGYFLVNSKMNCYKIFSLALPVYLCSWFFIIISYFLGLTSLSFNDVLISLFPILTGHYWFITNFLLLYISVPIINKLVLTISKEQYKKVLYFLFMLWCFIPTFINVDLGYSNFNWFVFLYLFSAYMKLYGIEVLNNKLRNFYIFSIFNILLIISVIMINDLSSSYSFLDGKELHFAKMNSLLMFFLSISYFCVFKNISLYKGLINYFSMSMFTVYLVHDNHIFRDYLWDKVIYSNGDLTIFQFVIFSFSSCLVVFVFSVFFDKVFLSPIIEKIKNAKGVLKRL